MSSRKMIRGGRNYVTSSPAFSNDAKKLLLYTANSVSVFSVATGLKIASLEDHTAPVTTVIVDSVCDKTLYYCWTASLDGKIRIWEFSKPKLLKTIVQVCPESLYGVRRYNLDYEETLLFGDTLKEMEEPKPIVMSPSGEFFGVCHNCEIHIWNATLGETEHIMAKEMTLQHTQLITVFAFHPNKRMLAAGDVTGRVLIWKEIGNGELTSPKSEDDAEICTAFNWHSTEVTVLNFSSDGAFLYSGGKEGVLVVWELDSGKKQLLPKIESPLLDFIFSSDPTLSSAICANNQIHLLKLPSMEKLRTISGIKPPASDPLMFICDDKMTHVSLIRSVSIDRSSGISALSTANHCVQLYNLLGDHEISEVQVYQSNHQPHDAEVRVLVTAVALSRNGSVMATAEAKFAAGNFSGGLVSLKFWVFVPENKTFSLSTVISQPHREAAITSIVLNPARSMAVSISSAGDFKTWVCNGDKNLTPEDSNWICHGVGSYKKRPITAATFSGDGTILAIAATTVLTLWNPLKNKLLFKVGKSNTPITEISIAGVFLVAGSRFPDSTPHLSVWDLMTFTLSWSYRLSIEAIATQADMLAPQFAVLTWFPESYRSVKSNEQIFCGKDGAILLFDGSGPKPVAIWTVMKARGGSLSFVEDSKKSQKLLAYVNGSHEYVIFDPFSDETLETSAKDYELLLAAVSKKNKRSRKKTLLALSKRPLETIFCGSTLNIPPFPDVCADFFASWKRKRICKRAEMQPESESP